MAADKTSTDDSTDDETTTADDYDIPVADDSFEMNVSLTDEIESHVIADDEDDDSHREYNPSVFHPSQVGYCKRRLMAKKLGLDDMSGLDGTFKIGNIVHDTIQSELPDDGKHWHEEEISHEERGIRIEGRYDIYNPMYDIVYDIKTRSSWYNFNPPVDRHLDQLHCYMKALDAEYGKIIYVSKKNFELKPFPEDRPLRFDESRWDSILDKCLTVRNYLMRNGFPVTEGQLDEFADPCDSYFCSDEDLDFSDIRPE